MSSVGTEDSQDPKVRDVQRKVMVCCFFGRGTKPQTAFQAKKKKCARKSERITVIKLTRCNNLIPAGTVKEKEVLNGQ